MNKILLTGGLDMALPEDGKASEIITPGYLVERGGSDDFQKHSTAGGNAQGLFADHRPELGEEISDDIPSGDTFRVLKPQPGQRINALVAAAAAAIALGDPLESAGDGTVQKWGTAAEAVPANVDNIVGYATEAVDNSGGASEARIKMEAA